MLCNCIFIKSLFTKKIDINRFSVTYLKSQCCATYQNKIFQLFITRKLFYQSQCPFFDSFLM